MNGIETLTGQITETARREADTILAAAERKSRSLAASYEQQAQAAYRARIRTGVQEHELRVQRLRKNYVMETKKQMLALKQELIAQVFVRAMEQLDAMEESEYIAFLAYLAGNAAESGTETVLFNEKDCAAIGSRVVELANRIRRDRNERGELILGAECRAMRHGLILQQDGMEINCSLEKLMALRRNELAARAAEILFD